MEALQDIQEIIDENKDNMPTGVVKALFDNSKEAIENFPKLYKLTWTMVDSHTHVVDPEDEPAFARVQLSHKTQTLLVKAVGHLPDHPNGHGGKIRAMDLPNHGMVFRGWVDHFTKQPSIPKVLMPSDDMAYGRTDCMVIVSSIEPYEPHKRAREE